jgi:hypothetical protein
MSGQDDRTDPDAPAVDLPKGVVTGESVPPDEHTLRVRTKREKEPGATLHVHDEKPPEPEPPSSTELADSSRRRMRRQRDQRAERRALSLLLFVFVGLGGAVLVGVNVLLEEPPPSDPAVPVEPPAKKSQLSGVYSSPIDETPALPAFESLRNEGLTIVAEGLPQVDFVGESGAAALAALETCRFAYAVWEFSPNKRFRFMSTCEALQGQVMVGAYEISGGMVKMSPLVSDTDAVTSEFRVEHPSRMVSTVSRRLGEDPVLEISQKVTAMRPGLDGEAWRDAFSSKNTIQLPTRAPDAPPPPREGRPPPPAKAKDPLLDLLQK